MVVKEGYKMTDVGVIPEDWDYEVLGDICSPSKARGIPSKDIHTKQCIDLEHIAPESGSLLGSFESTDVNSVRSIFIPGDVLFGRLRPYLRKYFYPSFEGYCSTEIWVLKNREKFDSRWLYHIVQTNRFVDAANQSSGTRMPRAEWKTVSETPIPVPPTKSEQTAIATALSDADALIRSLEKLIEKKRAIKQGAMQELLKPKEGWVVKQIGDIAAVGRGRVISHKEIAQSVSGIYPVYSSQTSNNGIMGFLDTYDFDGEYITWTTDGENAGTVFYRNGKFNCTNVCGTIKIKTNDNPIFITALLSLEAPNHVSRNLANPKLMNDPMKRIEIKVPDYQTQNQIVSILNDLSTDLEVCEEKLKKCKMLKQGMMKELLTGRIRLNH